MRRPSPAANSRQLAARWTLAARIGELTCPTSIVGKARLSSSLRTAHAIGSAHGPLGEGSDFPPEKPRRRHDCALRHPCDTRPITSPMALAGGRGLARGLTDAAYLWAPPTKFKSAGETSFVCPRKRTATSAGAYAGDRFSGRQKKPQPRRRLRWGFWLSALQPGETRQRVRLRAAALHLATTATYDGPRAFCASS